MLKGVHQVSRSRQPQPQRIQPIDEHDGACLYGHGYSPPRIGGISSMSVSGLSSPSAAHHQQHEAEQDEEIRRLKHRLLTLEKRENENRKQLNEQQQQKQQQASSSSNAASAAAAPQDKTSSTPIETPTLPIKGKWLLNSINTDTVRANMKLQSEQDQADIERLREKLSKLEDENSRHRRRTHKILSHNEKKIESDDAAAAVAATSSNVSPTAAPTAGGQKTTTAASAVPAASAATQVQAPNSSTSELLFLLKMFPKALGGGGIDLNIITNPEHPQHHQQAHMLKHRVLHCMTYVLHDDDAARRNSESSMVVGGAGVSNSAFNDDCAVDDDLAAVFTGAARSPLSAAQLPIVFIPRDCVASSSSTSPSRRHDNRAQQPTRGAKTAATSSSTATGHQHYVGETYVGLHDLCRRIHVPPEALLRANPSLLHSTNATEGGISGGGATRSPQRSSNNNRSPGRSSRRCASCNPNNAASSSATRHHHHAVKTSTTDIVIPADMELFLPRLRFAPADHTLSDATMLQREQQHTSPIRRGTAGAGGGGQCFNQLLSTPATVLNWLDSQQKEQHQHQQQPPPYPGPGGHPAAASLSPISTTRPGPGEQPPSLVMPLWEGQEKRHEAVANRESHTDPMYGRRFPEAPALEKTPVEAILAQFPQPPSASSAWCRASLIDYAAVTGMPIEQLLLHNSSVMEEACKRPMSMLKVVRLELADFRRRYFAKAKEADQLSENLRQVLAKLEQTEAQLAQFTGASSTGSDSTLTMTAAQQQQTVMTIELEYLREQVAAHRKHQEEFGDVLSRFFLPVRGSSTTTADISMKDDLNSRATGGGASSTAGVAPIPLPTPPLFGTKTQSDSTLNQQPPSGYAEAATPTDLLPLGAPGASILSSSNSMQSSVATTSAGGSGEGGGITIGNIIDQSGALSSGGDNPRGQIPAVLGQRIVFEFHRLHEAFKVAESNVHESNRQLAMKENTIDELRDSVALLEEKVRGLNDQLGMESDRCKDMAAVEAASRVLREDAVGEAMLLRTLNATLNDDVQRLKVSNETLLAQMTEFSDRDTLRELLSADSVAASHQSIAELTRVKNELADERLRGDDLQAQVNVLQENLDNVTEENEDAVKKAEEAESKLKRVEAAYAQRLEAVEKLHLHLNRSSEAARAAEQTVMGDVQVLIKGLREDSGKSTTPPPSSLMPKASAGAAGTVAAAPGGSVATSSAPTVASTSVSTVSSVPKLATTMKSLSALSGLASSSARAATLSPGPRSASSSSTTSTLSARGTTTTTSSSSLSSTAVPRITPVTLKPLPTSVTSGTTSATPAATVAANQQNSSTSNNNSLSIIKPIVVNGSKTAASVPESAASPAIPPVPNASPVVATVSGGGPATGTGMGVGGSGGPKTLNDIVTYKPRSPVLQPNNVAKDALKHAHESSQLLIPPVSIPTIATDGGAVAPASASAPVTKDTLKADTTSSANPTAAAAAAAAEPRTSASTPSAETEKKRGQDDISGSDSVSISSSTDALVASIRQSMKHEAEKRAAGDEVTQYAEKLLALYRPQH